MAGTREGRDDNVKGGNCGTKSRSLGISARRSAQSRESYIVIGLRMQKWETSTRDEGREKAHYLFATSVKLSQPGDTEKPVCVIAFVAQVSNEGTTSFARNRKHRGTDAMFGDLQTDPREA